MVEQSLDECWFGAELRPVAEAMGMGELCAYHGYGSNTEIRERFRFRFERGTIYVLASKFGLSATLDYGVPAFAPYVTIYGSYDEVLSAAQILGVNRLAHEGEDEHGR